jgi:transposase
MDAALQRCNIRISNYVSNVDTKGYREVVELLSEGTTDPELLTGKIHRRTINKHGRDTIKAALTGVVTDVDSDLLRQYREELDLLRRHKQECLSKMREMCEELYPDELKRIEEIPGISAQSATQIIAEIGADMKMFLTARTLVAWAGLKPRNDGSNGKIKSRRITHGNKYLRKLLIECAWAASRTKDSFFSSFSYRMVTVRKKGRLKVQVAIARKLLVVIWNLLAKGVQYSDRLAQADDTKDESSDTPQG